MSLTGGAAILARLRAQRGGAAAKPSAPADTKAKDVTANGSAAASTNTQPKQQQQQQHEGVEVTVLYASQTGTAQEIARDIQASAAQHGVKARVMSFNECGFDNLGAEKTPVVVAVASSTGDGDPPDNSAKAYQALRRRSNAPDLLAGVQFTVLGLGDSNYTRYMYVPRSIRKRMAELGAAEFYASAEADEVEGIESVVDPWVEGLWAALRAAVAKASGKAEGTAANGNAATAVADGVAAIDLSRSTSSVPPLPTCRISLQWESDDAKRRAVADAEARLPSEAQLQHTDAGGAYSAEQPFWARVAGARYLTSPDSADDRRVLHLELDVAGSGAAYAPGDSVGVVVPNDAAGVDALLARLGADPGAVFSVVPRGQGEGGQQHPPQADAAASERLLPHLGWPCTVRHAFLHGVDVTSPPRKSLLRLLAEHCADGGERDTLLRLCGPEGRGDYGKLVAAQPTLLQLLDRVAPSCKPPLDALLDVLPALMPRMYSITTAPQVFPDQVHVAFSVVDVATEYGRKRGVATTHLEGLCKPIAAVAATGQDSQQQQQQQQSQGSGPRLPVFFRSGGAFRPPQDLGKPWIMVGPGTGVAPFRGFLQARRAAIQAATAGGKDAAPAWLFFGCRTREADYLYREDLEGFAADGTLTRLEVAFSREQEGKKVYVQHLMRRLGKALFDLLEDGAHVFVCGDGSAMAKDVHACLQEIIAEHGGVDAKEAGEQLAHMAREGKYVRDIWS